jgi:hypothetical protein
MVFAGVLGHPVTHGILSGNAVVGYGSQDPNATNIGAIQLQATSDTQILNNTIDGYYQAAIMPYAGNWNAIVVGNTAGDLRGAAVPSYASMILLTAPGNWGLYVDGNTLAPGPASAPIAHFLANPAQANQITIGPNNDVTRYTGYTGAVFADFVAVGFAAPPATINFQPNDTGYNPYPTEAYQLVVPGFEGYSPTTSPKAYFSKDTTDLVATGELVQENGVQKIQNLSGGDVCGGAPFWYYCLPPGVHIVITPEPASGARPFFAVVTANDGTGLVIDTFAPTDLTQATIRWVDGTGIGAPCNSPSDCQAGLLCCYPCGVDGCQNQCMIPVDGQCPQFF